MLTPGQVEQFHQQGYLVLPAFLDNASLHAAQAALGEHFPAPEDYFADPQRYAWLQQSQFAGLAPLPWASFALNRLALYEPLLDIAEQLLGSPDIRLTKGELWAKYQGAIDYDQSFHRDFGNHTLVVPRRDHRYKELTTFIYLNDVVRDGGATAILPRSRTDDIAFGINRMNTEQSVAFNQYAEYAEGPAGTLVLYSYDVFHRGVQIRQHEASRFMLLMDYARQDAPWIDRHAWPHHGGKPQMDELIQRCSVRQRNLLDFPPPGHDYWNAQTLDDILVRYPDLDITPYQRAAAMTDPGQ